VIQLDDGQYEKFVEYVAKNHKYHERALFLYMIKSGQSLEWVVETLHTGRRIKNILKEYPHEGSVRDDISTYSSQYYQAKVRNRVQDISRGHSRDQSFDSNRSTSIGRKRYSYMESSTDYMSSYKVQNPYSATGKPKTVVRSRRKVSRSSSRNRHEEQKCPVRGCQRNEDIEISLIKSDQEE